jgi:hypothetical protein
MDKSALTRSIILQLEAELALQTEAAHGSREEATDEESRAEDRFDMRSQSAAYLAAGQARLASEIAGAIAAWSALTPRAFGPGDRIGAGALVTLEAGGARDGVSRGPAVRGPRGQGRGVGRHRRHRFVAARPPADRPRGGRHCPDRRPAWDRWCTGWPPWLRILRKAHQEAVALAGGAAAFVEGPDDQALAAAASPAAKTPGCWWRIFRARP